MSTDLRDLYQQFGDFLHEVPEAEATLAEWKARRHQQSLDAVRRKVEGRQQAARDQTWESLFRRLDTGLGPGSVQ